MISNFAKSPTSTQNDYISPAVIRQIYFSEGLEIYNNMLIKHLVEK